ncbi:MAG: hypothetical protein RSC43_00320 [Clostridia bacterium]
MDISINKLFKGICTLVFVFDDGSTVKSTATLNKGILAQYGVSELDGVIDLDLRKPIPVYMFDHIESIVEGTSVELSPIDAMFNLGGKVSW